MQQTLQVCRKLFLQTQNWWSVINRILTILTHDYSLICAFLITTNLSLIEEVRLPWISESAWIMQPNNKTHLIAVIIVGLFLTKNRINISSNLFRLQRTSRLRHETKSSVTKWYRTWKWKVIKVLRWKCVCCIVAGANTQRPLLAYTAVRSWRLRSATRRGHRAQQWHQAAMCCTTTWCYVSISYKCYGTAAVYRLLYNGHVIFKLVKRSRSASAIGITMMYLRV